MDDPCSRILHSATRHFAEFGFDDASVREIAGAAKVNSALINYYFRSKDDLYRAVVVQSVQRVAEARVVMLDALEKKAAGKPIPVEVILAATTGPVFGESKNPDTDRRAYIRFLSRLFTHPGPETVGIIFGGLKNLRERVFELLCQSIPYVSRKEMAWRYLFLSGSVHFTAGQIGYVEVISEGKCDSRDLSQALAHLIASQSAMLSAPATTLLHKKLARQYGKPPLERENPAASLPFLAPLAPSVKRSKAKI